ncbi:uncharacterized protein I206_106533 [Kwoniella pini CBS 10737]|uniref:Zn(2)-C6 fungal-type domain-containing protein n=1 Tax=Kwoniella pini CBS 10737 TaxID=1296096 RepID=A0A1B9HS94_9TREE|nr:uncharacterized protein I206_07921 [Kwoniella pini CBS 10737]OCF46136.1 hypothetical protein I206_07921 [Kwoniella pini CBS 10737]
MQVTSLSPRLRHLLITEDRRTNGYPMPSRSDPQSQISDSPGSDVGLDLRFIDDDNARRHPSLTIPTLITTNENESNSSSRHSASPRNPTGSVQLEISPHDQKRPLPIDVSASKQYPLPRPTSNIFSLLNGPSAGSPTSSASSVGSLSLRPEDVSEKRTSREKVQEKSINRKASSPYFRPTLSPTSAPILSPNKEYFMAPHTAPIINHRQSMYFDSRSPPPLQPTDNQDFHLHPSGGALSVIDSRPGLLRRHSSHPHEYPSHQQQQQRPTTAYATGPIYEVEYANMGARAPISRTTKACNACRNRKVRCDAGGGDMGPCSRCVESGTQCVYTGIQKKRGPCPGTARPSISKPRRPSTQSQISSHRSSVASVQSAQSFVVTPTDEQAPWSRSSYGFPPATSASVSNPSGLPTDSTEWSSIAPGKIRSSVNSQRGFMSNGPINGASVVSWSSNFEQTSSSHPSYVQERDRSNSIFDRNYALAPRNSVHQLDEVETYSPDDRMLPPRRLPPLNVAINDGTYYEC